jgi:hypothetical protein
MKLRQRLAVTALTTMVIGGLAFGGSAASADTVGDGTTAPTHDTGLAVIPLCNPFNVLTWLNVNFADHGRDISNYEVTLETPGQVFQYAGADALFHIPATLLSLGGFSDYETYCTVSYAPKSGA